MKRVVALVLTLMLALSCISFVYAEDVAATAEPVIDGFDFYSVTFHYDAPVVVGYKYETNINVTDGAGNMLKDDNGEQVVVKKGYVWADAVTEYSIPVVQFTKDAITNQILDYGDTVLKSGKTNTGMFYKVICKSLGIDSDKLKLTKNYGLTNIGDGMSIALKNAAKVYGTTAYYDDAGVINPNFTKENGYFIDARVDDNGTNYRIDANGYQIDANEIWHSIDGHRVEAFIEVDGAYVWLPIEARKIDGTIAELSDLNNQYLIDKGYLSGIPHKYDNATEEFDANFDYDGDGTISKTKDKTAWKSLVKEKQTWLKTCTIETYVVNYKDYTGDGKVKADDMTTYNALETTFTESDIMVKKQSDGTEMKVFGTPVIGTAKTNFKITSITVEIDAKGTSMPADLASDPQQANEVIVSYGDIAQNIETANAYVAEHPEKIYTDGAIIGKAKCVTTTTSDPTETGAIPSTVKSVELTLTEGVTIPANAMLYVTFKVGVAQAEHSYSKLSASEFFTINRAAIDVEKLPDAPKAEAEEKAGCGSVLGGGFAMVSVLCMAAVALKKMKKSAVLINVARGPVVNNTDLYEALVNGEIMAAGLDVLEHEPIELTNPLSKIMDSNMLIVTPHLAWASIEARTRCVEGAYNNIKAYIAGTPTNVVNP